ncbi:MAG: dihydrofolate reductase [Bacilli bacterium]
MIKLTIIAAIGANNELGLNNDLIWRLSADLKFFKKITMNKAIVMGYNTFKSLPALLPGRKHLVLSLKEFKVNDVICFTSMEKLLKGLKDYEDVFIIGGASIYEQFIDLVDVMYLTEIENSLLADVYFPDFNRNNWHSCVIGHGEEYSIKYKFVKYWRK